jgi:hypothetical protein
VLGENITNKYVSFVAGMKKSHHAILKYMVRLLWEGQEV